jgi:predicted acyltransferase
MQAPETKSQRIYAIDTFRGITIFAMIFVIAVAAGGYRDLPQDMSWFGSLNVSTWNHADVAWAQFVEQKLQQGYTQEQILNMPQAKLKDVGLTVTDLVAPFFVFIVGLCIPLSRARRGREWWNRVFKRTGMLIAAGILYISLILGLSWWWGILQAIGIAYLMGSASLKLSMRGRWIAIFAVLAFHLVMSASVDWWLNFGHNDQPFFRIDTLHGSMTRPLTVHCLPWTSIGYGVMTMIAVLLGEAVATREPKKIFRQGLLLAAIFMTLGYLIHKIALITGHPHLAFNKPDVSSAYAAFTAGLAALFFIFIYWITDIKNWKKWTFVFNVLGVNALLAYFMQVIMRLFFRALHIEDFFDGKPNPLLEQWAGLFDSPLWQKFLLDKSGYNGMLWGLIWTACLWGIIYFCNKKGIYWKL